MTSVFEDFDGYYSCMSRGIEYARFAPSPFWLEYVLSKESDSDFSCAVVRYPTGNQPLLSVWRNEMTKKDYEKVANKFNLRVTAVRAINTTAKGHPITSLSLDILFVLASDLCDVFLDDNPRFDQTQFLKACGFDVI